MRIYEINARVHCQKFEQVGAEELRALAALSFDAIWVMGVWQISKGAVKISRILSEDFQGSPYAVPAYDFNPAMGGKAAFGKLAERAHRAGLGVIVDFVSNHMALDSRWIRQKPEFFIRSNPEARNQSTGEYFLHPSGEVVAFGRDPFFPPWHDTAQLDYTNPALRSQMIDTLKWIARYADGVRCDMAMLVLRDHIYRQWYPKRSQAWFDEQMPEEFWREAIQAVKAERPDFLFIAETYWDKEQPLLEMGFDLVYEKKLYDGLVARNAQAVYDRLAVSPEQLRGSLCFIENHDEPRAASVFTPKNNLAAAALILALPSSSLIHEGQMEGKHERLPVQRLQPLIEETTDTALYQAYLHLLKVTAAAVFRNGTFQLFDSGVWGAITFLRQDANRLVAYLGQISEAWHTFHSVPFDLTPLAHRIGATGRLHITNLLNQQFVTIGQSGGAFLFRPEQFGVPEGAQFCLLEVTRE